VLATLVLLGLVVALAAAAAEIGSCACDMVVVVSSAGAVLGVPTAPPITTAEEVENTHGHEQRPERQPGSKTLLATQP